MKNIDTKLINDARNSLLMLRDKNENGAWDIYGESLDGFPKKLQTVTGKYSNVVEHALSLSTFFGFGWGRIEYIGSNILCVDK